MIDSTLPDSLSSRAGGSVMRHSPYITSYDFLKFFAVLTMIVDHVGYYFYPDIAVLRLIGRMSFPCWMFLIGFANTREITKPLMAGCLFLVLSNFVMGTFLLPINILGTVILLRLGIDRMARFTFRGAEFVYYTLLISVIVAFPLYFVFEYSSFAVLMALFGYLARHRGETNLGSVSEKMFFLLTIVFCTIGQGILFNFSALWMAILGGGYAVIGYVLYRFQAREYPALTQALPLAVVRSLQFFGRYTLEIYVVHVALLGVLQKVLSDGPIHWFQPSLIYP